MERLDARIRNVWITVSILTGLVIGSVLGGLSYLGLESPILTAFLVSVFPVAFSVYSFYRYRNWFFEVHPDYLEINHGVLRKTSAVIPYVRVQHIDTNRGPLERILGLASLRVYTAGSKGADMKIPGLERGRAEQMQEDLKQKAIESEHGFDGV
ncbi:MAG: PH domain-containing protein [Candidatus Nanohaloarchaea archaeon]